MNNPGWINPVGSIGILGNGGAGGAICSRMADGVATSLVRRYFNCVTCRADCAKNGVCAFLLMKRKISKVSDTE